MRCGIRCVVEFRTPPVTNGSAPSWPSSSSLLSGYNCTWDTVDPLTFAAIPFLTHPIRCEPTNEFRLTTHSGNGDSNGPQPGVIRSPRQTSPADKSARKIEMPLFVSIWQIIPAFNCCNRLVVQCVLRLSIQIWSHYRDSLRQCRRCPCQITNTLSQIHSFKNDLYDDHLSEMSQRLFSELRSVSNVP